MPAPRSAEWLAVRRESKSWCTDDGGYRNRNTEMGCLPMCVHVSNSWFVMSQCETYWQGLRGNNESFYCFPSWRHHRSSMYIHVCSHSHLYLQDFFLFPWSGLQKPNSSVIPAWKVVPECPLVNRVFFCRITTKSATVTGAMSCIMQELDGWKKDLICHQALIGAKTQLMIVKWGMIAPS